MALSKAHRLLRSWLPASGTPTRKTWRSCIRFRFQELIRSRCVAIFRCGVTFTRIGLPFHLLYLLISNAVGKARAFLRPLALRPTLAILGRWTWQAAPQ